MKIRSKVTGAVYDPSPKHVLYIGNWEQFVKYMANGADSSLVDLYFDRSQGKNKMVFVFERNELMKELYRKWNNYELNIN